jgi:hypothetical protein
LNIIGEVPEEYITVIESATINKNKIKQDIKNGVDINFATLEQKNRIEII